MPNYDYDPSDYSNDKGSGGGGDYLPVGKHIVRVIDHELSETKSGLGQVIVTFSGRDGRTRKAWLICEGKAGFQFGGLLNACDWTSKIDLSKSGLIKKAVYGKDVEIIVADEEYQGKSATKVKYINKAPGGFGSVDGGRPQARDERPGPPDDDQIPF